MTLAGTWGFRRVSPHNALCRVCIQAVVSILFGVFLSASAEPNAEEIALADGEIRIFLANADGSNMKRLANLPEFAFQGSPNWSQDGNRIAFDAWRAGESSNDARIVVINADGSEPRVLGDGAMPSFSPGGKRIAFSRYAPNQGVWVMSSQGPEQELVMLDDQGWGARWSPDGTRIAYTISTNAKANLAVFNLLEGFSANVFEEGKEPYTRIYWNFAWSPDSRQIVFLGEKVDAKKEVAIVDARGASAGFSTRLNRDVSPNFAWSPDRARILLSFGAAERGGRAQLYFIDPRTNDLPQLLPGQDPELSHNGMAYSPDGQRLAISSRKPPLKQPKAKQPGG